MSYVVTGTRGSIADLRGEPWITLKREAEERFMWLVINGWKVERLKKELQKMADAAGRDTLIAFDSKTDGKVLVGLHWKKRGAICFALVLQPIKYSTLSFDDFELKDAYIPHTMPDGNVIYLKYNPDKA